MLMKHTAKAPTQNSNDAIIAKTTKIVEEVKPKKKAKKKSTKE